MIRRLGSRYELQEPIGGGGMAVVYRAVDTLLDRTVAVKMLRPQYAGDEEFVARFRQEAQSAARLSHPNIVNLYDIGVVNNEYYLVMEYVDGPTLKEVIRQSAPMEIEDVVDIASQICDALEHAHMRQIIHRDIKPHNILITNSGQVKVTDFGIARAITGNTITYQQATSVLGSVHYFSPEQARGAAADVKSDIYSLGVVMYEMLTDQLPFSGDTPVSVALKHLRETVQEPRTMFPEIPQSVENIVLRCLVKSPDKRYPDMKSVKQDLNRALAHPDVPKFEMPPIEEAEATISLSAVGVSPEVATVVEEPIQPPKRRRRAARILIGVSVSACVLIVAAIAAYYIEFGVFARGGPTLTMPNVVGKSETDAVKLLEQDKFLYHNIIVKRTYNPHAAGVVYNQDPKSPTTVKQTREVYLFVSRGPQQISMPYLLNYPKDQAVQELINEGFSQSNIKIQHMHSDTYDQGTVVDTTPEAGSKVSLDDSVTVTISDGPVTRVPMVVGLSVPEAKQFILTEGLQVGNVYYQAAPGSPDGTVFNSSPAPETQVNPGSSVDLYVASNSMTQGGSPTDGTGGGTAQSTPPSTTGSNGSDTGTGPATGTGGSTQANGTTGTTQDGTGTSNTGGTSGTGSAAGSGTSPSANGGASTASGTGDTQGQGTGVSTPSQ